MAFGTLGLGLGFAGSGTWYEPGATLDFDFRGNRYLLDGTPYSAASDVLTTTRASKAWYDGWDQTSGAVVSSLTEFATGVARVGTLGVGIESSSTNEIRNPRFEGATVGEIGSGGVMPTHMAVTVDGGMTWEVDAVGEEDGWPYLELSISGTATGDARIDLETLSGIAAVAGEDWNLSCCVKVISGTVPGTLELNLYGVTSGGAEADFVDATDISPDGTLRRFTYTRTLANTTATVANVVPNLYFDGPSGSVSCTLRVYAPQAEQKDHPSSVILPAVGTPAATTRSDESHTRVLGSEFDTTQGTVLIDYVAGGEAGKDYTVILAISDNTGSNLMRLEGPSWANLRALIWSGGSLDVNANSAHALAPGDDLRMTVGFANNDFAISYEGDTQDTDTSITIPTWTHLHIGSNFSGLHFGGYVKRVTYIPERKSNAYLEYKAGN